MPVQLNPVHGTTTAVEFQGPLHCKMERKLLRNAGLRGTVLIND